MRTEDQPRRPQDVIEQLRQNRRIKSVELPTWEENPFLLPDYAARYESVYATLNPRIQTCMLAMRQYIEGPIIIDSYTPRGRRAWRMKLHPEVRAFVETNKLRVNRIHDTLYALALLQQSHMFEELRSERQEIREAIRDKYDTLSIEEKLAITRRCTQIARTVLNGLLRN